MLAERILAWLGQLGLTGHVLARVGDLLGLVALIVCAWLSHWLARGVLLRIVSAVVRRTPTPWDDVLLEAGVFARLAHLAPALVVGWLGEEFFVTGPRLLVRLDMAFDLYVIVIVLMVTAAAVNGLLDFYHRQSSTSRVPLKSFAQAFMLFAYVVGFISALSVLMDRAPVYLLSGVGALTAILLLIFKDAILGFVAGIQISVNRMVQLGDWIEMQKYGADGTVVDVTLTTVKVQNWDMTITTVPTYALISDPVKNWRAMSEAGGRRIKRSIWLDMQSFRFVDDELFARLSKVDQLRPYLEAKRDELKTWNEKAVSDPSVALNGRRLTNVGCFRAYTLLYLRANPLLRQDMTLLVRQLEPSANGLPLEIYAFVSDTRLQAYEDVQSDIFDHLVTAASEFDLRIYQSPSSTDVRPGARSAP